MSEESRRGKELRDKIKRKRTSTGSRRGKEPGREKENAMEQMRLDKFLTQTAGLTRSEAKQYLKKGRVCVDGAVVKKPETKIDADTAEVTVDGKNCHYEKYTYLMLHKPQGVVSATEDGRERTVLDLIREPARGLFPVGRLDKDTEGMLLLTNDGELAHALLSPRKHVEKCYFALLDGPVGKKEQEAFAEGLDIGDEKKTLPARLLPAQDARAEQDAQAENADESGDSLRGFGVYITVCEGRFHQVKRMARAVGRKVLYLKRISMGSLRLDESLAPGEYRPLTEEELQGLKRGKTDRK